MTVAGRGAEVPLRLDLIDPGAAPDRLAPPAIVFYRYDEAVFVEPPWRRRRDGPPWTPGTGRAYDSLGDRSMTSPEHHRANRHSFSNRDSAGAIALALLVVLCRSAAAQPPANPSLRVSATNIYYPTLLESDLELTLFQDGLMVAETSGTAGHFLLRGRATSAELRDLNGALGAAKIGSAQSCGLADLIYRWTDARYKIHWFGRRVGDGLRQNEIVVRRGMSATSPYCQPIMDALLQAIDRLVAAVSEHADTRRVKVSPAPES